MSFIKENLPTVHFDQKNVLSLVLNGREMSDRKCEIFNEKSHLNIVPIRSSESDKNSCSLKPRERERFWLSRTFLIVNW